MNTIRIEDAARLAFLHHTVMTITTTGTDFHVNVMTTARKVVEEYFALCSRTGVKLYNEHYEESARRTVEAIEARNAAKVAKIAK